MTLFGNGSGLWTLVVVDDAGGDVGTLDNWSITLDYLAGNGTTNSETLNGTADTDRMYGRAGNDKINALAGDDFLFGGDGTDTLTGGLGRDMGGTGCRDTDQKIMRFKQCRLNLRGSRN